MRRSLAAGRIGVDVGGTFTDVLLHADDGRVGVRKLLSTPPSYDLAVVEAVSGLAGGETSRRRQRGRPRHHGRDERRAAASRRRDRPRHDQGLPRRPRAAAPADPAHVRPLLAQATPARRAAAALRGGRADGGRRHRAAAARRGRGARARVPAAGPRRSTRSPSASCTPTSIPSTRSGSARSSRRSFPRRPSRSRARSCASSASTSGPRRRSSTRTCGR